MKCINETYLACFVTTLLASPATADVLYDTLPALGGGSGSVLPGAHPSAYTLVPSFIGASGVFGMSFDMQSADDFHLSNTHSIDYLSVDISMNPESAPFLK